ncbi:MAG: class I SAM-dependent methyltransferase [Coriobacteriales bacterium]|nr:class I SAM-dependent methyltransferase [Coriobacteriales bacterium]MBQ6585310.1 class I SAM-dependent methyltransferase [Coriobacteriales bacterium]
MQLRPDLMRMLPRLKLGKLQGELLVKAARIKGVEGEPIAIDATAGLGEDALLLAASGYRVILFERDPVIAALLADALERAAEQPQLAPHVARMELRQKDSIPYLRALEPGSIDLVYLDPMFPARSKSAAVKKKFQLLHQLEAPCPDEQDLLAAAIAAKPRRIIVKRPVKGALLAGIKPSYQLRGKAIRYDVIVNS